MDKWSQFTEALKYDPSRLIYLDVSLFGLPQSNLYFFLDYLNHDEFSGNKLRKLYGTLKRIKDTDYKYIITIGGNYSNYLYACGFLPELIGKKMVVMVKGHEPKEYGFTLSHLSQKGVDLLFYSREDIRNHLDEIRDSINQKYSNAFFIPEGGNNEFAHEGFESLVKEGLSQFDVICTPVGTSATYKGIMKHVLPNQEVHGYSAHLDYSLENQGKISFDYSFGGFAKFPKELHKFCDEFEEKFKIKLDPIYTSKMMYGIFKDIEKGKYAPDSKIVAIHTGGLQGWNGIA